MCKKINKYNMHVPSTVQNQLFIFIIYDVPHIPHLLEDGLQLRISGPCKNWYVTVLITRTQWKTMENCVIYWPKSKLIYGVHRTIIFISMFKSCVECFIFLRIYELQLHKKKCIFIFHGSFCPLKSKIYGTKLFFRCGMTTVIW